MEPTNDGSAWTTIELIGEAALAADLIMQLIFKPLEQNLPLGTGTPGAAGGSRSAEAAVLVRVTDLLRVHILTSLKVPVQIMR